MVRLNRTIKFYSLSTCIYLALYNLKFGIFKKYIKCVFFSAAIHSIYKFGFCRPDATASVYLRKESKIHFPSYQSTQADYIYVSIPRN